MHTVGRHAVVIGASMAGLLTARVLAEAYDHVTIVERDILPACGEHRRSVPQAQHLHGLLASGLAVLETLFEGFAEEMMMAGALLGDVQADGRWYLDGHHYRQVPSGLHGLTMSRPLLEGHVRQRVRDGPGGTTEPGVPVATVCLAASGVGLVPAVLGAAAW